jgi:hypothetical protein
VPRRLGHGKAVHWVAEAAGVGSSATGRKRFGAALYSLFVTPRRSWIEDSTDVVVDELGRFDLVASRAHVSELIRGRITAVATGLDIKEQSARRYLHEEALRDLAREVAVRLADEQPGANLHQLPRTIPMSPQGFGICIAALAEVGHFRELNADAVGVHGALQMISLFAQVLYELPEASEESFFLPRAALTRTARLLDASAQMIRDGAVVSADLGTDSGPALADAFARDASTLRSLLGENDD